MDPEGRAGDLHARLDLRAGLLGLVECDDEAVVLEDVALGIGEQLQDQLLEVVLRLLVRGDLHDELLGGEGGQKGGVRGRSVSTATCQDQLNYPTW